MDPISIAGLVVTIGEVVSSLYEYGRAVKDSKDEIRKLTQEMFALKGALETISSTTRTYLSKKESQDDERNLQNESMLTLTRETLGSLQTRLVEPKNSFQRAKQALKWPFTKGEIERYIAGVERCKTWFIMVSMNDTVERTTAIYDEVRQLAETVHEDIILRRTNTMMKEMEEVIEWLAPVRSDEEHVKNLRHRVAGTGRWFFDESFEEWIVDPNPSKPILWVAGKC